MLAELDWDNSSKILTIRGTVYFDGSLTMSQAAPISGVNSSGVIPRATLTGNDGIGGQAVLYASGAFTSQQQRAVVRVEHPHTTGGETGWHCISAYGRRTRRC